MPLNAYPTSHHSVQFHARIQISQRWTADTATTFVNTLLPSSISKTLLLQALAVFQASGIVNWTSATHSLLRDTAQKFFDNRRFVRQFDTTVLDTLVVEDLHWLVCHFATMCIASVLERNHNDLYLILSPRYECHLPYGTMCTFTPRLHSSFCELHAMPRVYLITEFRHGYVSSEQFPFRELQQMGVLCQNTSSGIFSVRISILVVFWDIR